MSLLNPPQQQAIHAIDRPLLVLAGAGSGKTTVITRKIAHLVSQAGIQPQHIFAVTFTNKAAREMKQRVAKLVDSKVAQKLTVSTFHTLGLNIIRQEYQALNMKKGFSIFDAQDGQTLLKELLPEKIREDKAAVNSIQHTISNWKNAMLTPEQALAQAETGNEQAAAQAYGDYERHLRAYNAVDFDDLILRPTRLLQDNLEVRERWQNKVRYLLVDEYQDTNASQYQLVKLLVGLRQAFTVVGDDDQSIYTWRGAVPENLAKLQTDYPGLDVIKLEQNYRSSRRILKAANQVIANNDHLFEKKLWSDLGFGDAIRVVQCQDDEAEVERIAVEIASRRVKSGHKFKDYAILYRGNHQARLLEIKLQQNDVPYKVSGGTSFFERAEIKDLMAYLRLIANPDDDNAFLRIINVPRRQIGPATLEALGNYANGRHVSLYTAANEMGLREFLKPQQQEKLERFSHWLLKTIQTCCHHGPMTGLEEMLDALDYENWLIQTSSSRAVAEKRWGNVRFFMDILGKSFKEDSDDDGDEQIAKVVTRLMLQDIAERDEDGQEANQVQLMTLHAAKGLEFPHVYIMGLEEELLPHRGNIEDDNIEEERRLFYVGITRAQRSLTLTLCSQRKQYGELISSAPSRFLDELPQDDLEWEGGDKVDPAAKRERGQSALAGLHDLMST